jgi:hypothetical protein
LFGVESSQQIGDGVEGVGELERLGQEPAGAAAGDGDPVG